MVQDPGIPQERQPQVDVCPGRLGIAVRGIDLREAAQLLNRRKLPLCCHLRRCCYQPQLAACPTKALMSIQYQPHHGLCSSS